MLELIYISKSMALDAGLTHEGTLYGVPAWFDGDEHSEDAMATPKIPLLHLWCLLGDLVFYLACYLMPPDCELVTYTITGKIGAKP